MSLFPDLAVKSCLFPLVPDIEAILEWTYEDYEKSKQGFLDMDHDEIKLTRHQTQEHMTHFVAPVLMSCIIAIVHLTEYLSETKPDITFHPIVKTLIPLLIEQCRHQAHLNMCDTR